MNKNGLKSVPALPEEDIQGQDQVQAEPSAEFVNSSYVRDLTARAISYLEVGYPVNLAGPAGTGKTTLAFHIAAQLGRPVTLIHGDDEFGSSDLIGQDSGYKFTRIVDNYIHSVMRTEEELNNKWVNNRLTTACLNGYTLVYDEFTRSKPEANNALLSILEEKILNLPKLKSQGEGYIEVHPQFRAIFTSNPLEYVGVHKTQDALMDRLITINLSHYNRSSEIQIVMAKSGLSKTDAGLIVSIVRDLREIGVKNNRPTIRASIALAKVLAHIGGRPSYDNPAFRQICHDILDMDTANVTKDGKPVMEDIVEQTLKKICKPKSKKIKKP